MPIWVPIGSPSQRYAVTVEVVGHLTLYPELQPGADWSLRQQAEEYLDTHEHLIRSRLGKLLKRTLLLVTPYDSPGKPKGGA